MQVANCQVLWTPSGIGLAGLGWSQVGVWALKFRVAGTKGIRASGLSSTEWV